MAGATAVVIIIRMAVLVPIPMAETAATVGGTEGAMVVGMDTSTMEGFMGNGVAVAAGMDMDQGTSSVITSQLTSGLLLLHWLL
jgi:hypothetical protein